MVRVGRFDPRALHARVNRHRICQIGLHVGFDSCSRFCISIPFAGITAGDHDPFAGFFFHGKGPAHMSDEMVDGNALHRFCQDDLESSVPDR